MCSVRWREDLWLTLRGGGSGHLCSSILQPCRQEEAHQRNVNRTGEKGAPRQLFRGTSSTEALFFFFWSVKVSPSAARRCRIILCCLWLTITLHKVNLMAGEEVKKKWALKKDKQGEKRQKSLSRNASVGLKSASKGFLPIVSILILLTLSKAQCVCGQVGERREPPPQKKHCWSVSCLRGKPQSETW